MEKQNRFYEFANFRIDIAKHRLLKDGELLPVTPKAVEILLLLAQNSGRIVEKDELMAAIWPDTIVEESNLTQTVYVLRKILGQDANGEKFIQTIPKRGYRFLHELRVVPDESDLSIEHRTQSPMVIRQPALTPAEEMALPETLGANERNSHRRLRVGWRFLLPLSAAALVTTLFFLYWNHKSSESRTSIHSIAVLPFQSIGLPESDSYLGLGLADALISRLGNLKQVQVRPTSAVRIYVTPPTDLKSVGAQLKVDALLEGNIQRVGDRIRVTVELVNVADGAQLWSRQFDEQLTDMLGVEDAISTKVTGSLATALTAQEQTQLAKRYTNNPEAYQAYLKARYYYNKGTADGWQRTLQYFNEAVEKDPNFALAHAGLADAYQRMASVYLPAAEAEPLARSEALRALQLDDTLHEAHLQLGLVKLYYDWDWRASDIELSRAIELNPNYVEGHSWRGLYLMCMGRFDEAIAEMKRAEQLDPVSLPARTLVGWAYFHARRFDEAIKVHQATLEMDQNFEWAHQSLGWAYVQKGSYKEAIDELKRARELLDSSFNVAGLGYAYAMAGNRNEAQKSLAELIDRSKREHVPFYLIAVLYGALGQKQEALASLEEGYKTRAGQLIYLRVDPRLDVLRSEPGFKSLLQRLNLN
jgi:DNA-binding winged helix-turn-helix (wHTH) protein/TolB-like protein/Flp pilus assembly protein TadD